MDWVTLGYEIKPPVKNKLESLGVQVTSKLVPSQVDFDLSREQLMVGETLRLTGTSSGVSIAKHGVDWGDGSREYIPPSPGNDQSAVEHRFDKPGKFVVRYYISTQSGRRENLAKHVTVLPPALPRVTIQTKQSTIRIGSPTKFSVQPALKNVACRWDTADGQRDDSPTASFRFENVGMTKVRLVVTDEWGQTQRAETSVYVAPPEQRPKAEFEIPDELELEPGSPVTLVAFGSDTTDQVQWSVDSIPVSDEREFDFVPGGYGRFKLGLRVLDRFGRMDRQQKELVVPRPHKPSAGVSVPSSEIVLGDSVVLTDESSGVIDECRYSVSGKPDWTAKESLDEPRPRTFRWKPEELGPFEITQTVVGPGGQDSDKATVVVVPKGDQIVADFGVDWNNNRGATDVYFSNLSLGSVYRCEFDPGDGSEPIVSDGLADFQFLFQPGVWQPTITLHPDPDSGWTPVVWESDPIHIQEPVSVSMLVAAGSAVLLLASGCGLIAYRRRRDDHAHEQSQQRVKGSVTLRSLDNPLDVRTIEFDGHNELESISLSNEAKIELRAAPDPMLDDCRVRMKIDDPELQPTQIIELAMGESVEFEEYAITYDG